VQYNKAILAATLLLASCADGEAPVIVETTQLINTADEIGPYEVICRVIDNRKVDKAILYYGRESYGSEGVKTVGAEMELIGEERYRGEIPGFPFGTIVIYYVAAVDADGNRGRDPEEGFYKFQVFEGSPTSEGE
jgi:hypothetical protein